VGNTFVGNRIYEAPAQAVLGGGNEAVCGACHRGAPPANASQRSVPRWSMQCVNQSLMDDSVCGASDNLFEGNFFSNLTFDVGDAGAFYSCGQSGTGFTNRGNVIRGNVFENVRSQVVHPNLPSCLENVSTCDGTGFGNPNVNAVYFDDSMSGWSVINNSFANVMNGVLINGGRDTIVRDNRFDNVSNVVYLVDECPTPGQAIIWYALVRAYSEL
jgi:hypothetical protein